MNYNKYSFKTNFLLRNKYIQTILGSLILGNEDLPSRTLHKVLVDKRTKLILFELSSTNRDAPIILLLHGMGGCSESGYMRRIAQKLWVRGFTIFMMNQRGSGLGAGLCDRLWNGGSSDDLDAVVNFISKVYPRNFIYIVGFSLSGNILLKYLGEKGVRVSKVRKAIAVNPPIDLKRASHILSKNKEGILFNNYYMRQIHIQIEAMTECFPDAFAPSVQAKTILEFDDLYTAPVAGYKNVDEYYSDCSAKDYLEDISVPTTILCAVDDPFIDTSIFKSVRMSSSIELNTPDFGGHMGYLSSKLTPLGDYRWMDFMVCDWSED